MAKCGRKPALDEIKKREIIALLSVGCSRRTAAKYVGCDPRTIPRTAEREPKFAMQIDRAENQQEVTYLRRIQEAAQNAQYWRAAAWMLERKFPNVYGRRGPDVITVDQVRDLLVQFAEIIVEEIPAAKYRKPVLKRLAAISDTLKDTSKK